MYYKTKKNYLCIWETLNTTNLLVNSFTWTQMKELFYQNTTEKNESVVTGREVWDETKII